MLTQLCNAYLSEGDKHIQAIRTALDSSDSKALRAQLHKYKGTLMGLQSDPLLAQLAKLQDAARQQQFTKVASDLPKLGQLHQQLLNEIKHCLRV